MGTADERLAEVNRELRGGNVKWGAFRATRGARGAEASFAARETYGYVERNEESDVELLAGVRTSRGH